ncbi:diguanylate cyclase [Pseudomonas sp. LP_7_YM]|uniref:diguanylate cyclase n=1 Tax=Pseudomonas sp. LP_7_YM TaxID=2485137 RepID=UPI001060FDEC|nr:diguanylate cyclase [Pseudomonas sp. LP_7_YM]TDV59843.1 diguanylate cyclase [Pseudomonas sp. LP_7_YM]
MSDEVERWKEKYFKSIEQQDKLEERWNARLDLLRRGLVRSSLAAEGADRAVDQCMKEMREVVRKDDMDAGLAALIPRLEKAVLESEQRREQRAEQMGTALTALVTQLQSLPLPKEVTKPLKRFAKGLEERVNQARELPLLLSELSGLQGEALSRLEHVQGAARPGLLQRLFGGREAVQEVSASVSDLPDARALTPEILTPAPVEGEAPSEPKAQAAQWTNEAPPAAIAGSVDEPTASTAPAVEASEPTMAPEPPAPVVPTPATEADTEASEPAIEVESDSVERVDSVVGAIAQEHPKEVAPAEPETLSVGQTDQSPVPNEAVEVREQRPKEHAEAVANEADQEPNGGGPDEEATVEPEPDPDLAGDESDDEGPYALPSSPEPSYSSVAVHIEDTLLGLLNELALPEHHRPQAEAMRVRLENGLNWYELLPILDDLAVLMLAITDSGQHEFELYLKQLNERLVSFQANLQAASDDHAGQQTASRELNDQLREYVGDLQSSVQEAADLSSLKTVLETRLESLLGTMDAHQKQRDEREHEVASRLQALASRVATMEQEAIGIHAHLEEQRQKALIDTLTGLPNRAAWNERLEYEVGQLHKHRSSLLLGILDLDHFKRINDGYGHLAGDKVLKIVATQLKKHLRASDFIARFGGEEFVVLLPHTQSDDGIALLERVRQTIEQCPFHFKGERVTITVSMGMTTFKPGEHSDLVLKRADQALYRAKHEGRNRIEQG